MAALILALTPSVVSGFAVVAGRQVYEAGSWDFLRGSVGSPIHVAFARRLIAKQLSSAVEQLAFGYPLDTIVVERSLPGQKRLDLVKAIHEAAIRSKTHCEDVEFGIWRTSVPSGFLSMEDDDTAALSICDSEGMRLGNGVSVRALLIGRYASPRTPSLGAFFDADDFS